MKFVKHTEIEAKIKLNPTQELEELLLSWDCTYEGQVVENNKKYFGLGLLKKMGVFVRLRTEYTREGQNYILTLKGRKQESEYTKRNEWEAQDIPGLTAHLIGMIPHGEGYSKVRQNYLTPDGCVISLDQRSDKNRVEVEGPNEDLIRPWVEKLKEYKHSL